MEAHEIKAGRRHKPITGDCSKVMNKTRLPNHLMNTYPEILTLIYAGIASTL